jgi:hypothetical protein
MQFGMVDVVERREEEETGGRKGNMVQTQAGIVGKRQSRNGYQATTGARTWQELAVKSRKVQTWQHHGTVQVAVDVDPNEAIRVALSMDGRRKRQRRACPSIYLQVSRITHRAILDMKPLFLGALEVHELVRQE